MLIRTHSGSSLCSTSSASTFSEASTSSYILGSSKDNLFGERSDSGYSSDEELLSHPKPQRLHKRKSHRRHRHHSLQLEAPFRDLPALPKSFLASNPALSEAMLNLSRATRHLSPEPTRTSFSSDEHALHREERLAEPDCTECRLERALLFSNLGQEDIAMIPEGLKRALAFINSSEE